MRAPPDIQVSSILYYLGEALRQDEMIQKWTEARPEEIVASTVEHVPMDVGSSGKGGMFITLAQMPALCLSINSERFKAVPGTGYMGKPPRGREFQATLWYLFQPFQSESRDIHGLTKGDRLCTLIWWRIKHHLARQKLGPDAVPVFDLQEVSKIRTLEMTDSSERVVFDIVQGMKIPLTVWHGFAPYEEVDPAILELISIGITADAGAGYGVDADVDVSAP